MAKKNINKAELEEMQRLSQSINHNMGNITDESIKQNKEFQKQKKQQKDIAGSVKDELSKKKILGKINESNSKTLSHILGISSEITKENNNSQKAVGGLTSSYDTLKSMISGMSDTLTEMSDLDSAQSDNLQNQFKLHQSIIKSIKGEETIQQAIIDLENERVNLGKLRGIENDDTIKQLEDVNSLIQGQLGLESQRLGILGKVTGITNDVASSTQGVFEGLKSSIEGIPILGKVFSSLIPFDYINNSISLMSKNFIAGFGKSFVDTAIKNQGVMGAFSSSISAGFKGMKAAASKFWAVVTSPLGIAIAGFAAIAAVVGLGVLRMSQMDSAVHHVGESTGLLHSQLYGVDKTISAVHANTAGLGTSFDDVANTVSDFSNAFEGTQSISEGVLNSMVVLNKNFGVTTQSASQLNRIFQNIGDLSAEQSQHLIGQTVQLAKQAGVAPSKVIEDIANNSEVAYKFFQGNAKELAKAAVEARLLGTNIGALANTAETLLDFESSITAELEAGAMMGTNFNFSQARGLAYAGETVKMQKSILKEIEAKTDITKLDIFQQRALAKASGMEFGELSKQIKIRKQFGKLKGDDLATAMALFDAGKDITKMSKIELGVQTQKMKKDQDRQTKLAKMGNSLKEMGSVIMDALLPVGEVVFAALTPIIGILKMVAPLIVMAFKPLTWVLGVVNNVFSLFTALANDGIGGVLDKFKEMGPWMSFFTASAATFASIWAVSILPSIVASGISLVTTTVPAMWKAVAGAGAWAIEQAGILMSSIGTGLTMVGSVIPAIWTAVSGAGIWAISQAGIALSAISTAISLAGGILPALFKAIVSAGAWAIAQASVAVASITTTVALTAGIAAISIAAGIGAAVYAMNNSQSEAENAVPAGSINDGIVQQGKIISTHPEDTIIATQTPETLLSANESAVNNISIDNSDMISKMDEMISAIRSGKDIFLDKEKVTNSIMKQKEKTTGNTFGLGVA